MWGYAILGTQFKFKKNLEGKLIATNGNLWALLDFRTPHLLLLMILMQNFILINNYTKPQA